MESSQDVGAEKWSGSESGWTMYICSPSLHSESNGDYYISDHKEGGDENNGKKAIHEYFSDDGDGYDDDESDDSMASDASSGPCHQREVVLLPCGIGEGSRSAEERQHGNYKCPSSKRVVTCRKEKKRDERRRIKEEKEEFLLHKADSASSHV